MPTIDPALQEFFSTPDTPNKNTNTQPVPITETIAPEPKPTGKPQPVDPNLLNFFNEEKTNYQKIQPKQSGLVKDPKEDDFGFWRIVGDMTLSIPQGVVNAVEEQGDFLDENIVSLGGIEFGDKDGKLSFKDFIPQYVSPKRWKEQRYSEERQLPLFYKPKTLAGNITEGVSRFITGFYLPNKFLKGAGLVGGFGVTALRGMSAGAVADLTVFDPNEGRLSDMLVEFDSPVLNNAVTQYLATDEEDTEMEGRLKNVLEGMIIGGVAEGVLFGIKAFKKAKATKNFDEKNAIYKEAGEAIKEVQNPKSKTITLNEYSEISSKGEIKQARTEDQNFEAILSGEIKAVEFNFMDSTSKLSKEYESGTFTKKIENKKLYIEDDKMGKVYIGKTKKDVDFLKNSENPYDYGISSGYSENDIAAFYLKKRGGNTKLAYEEFISDRQNYINKTKQLTTISPIVRKAIVDGNPAINVDELTKEFKIGEKTAKADSESFIKKILNTKSFRNAEHVLKTIDDAVEQFDDATKNFLENDVLRNDVAEELAKTLARNKDELLRALPKQTEAAKQGTVRMLATKMVLQEIARNLQDTSIKYVKQFKDNEKLWTKEARQEIANYTRLIQDVTYSLKEQIRNAARQTQAGRIQVGAVGGKVIDAEKAAEFVRLYNSNPIILARKFASGSLDEVIQNAGKTKYQKAIEVFNSAYINSLLSGVFTQAVNLKSGLYEALIRPMEQVIGGAIARDKKSIQLGFAQYRGMVMSFRDTWKAVGIALRQGDAVLDPLARTQDNLQIVNGKAVRPISAANLGFNGRVGTAVDWIGRVIELPSRLLLTSDEFLKQINYRGRLLSNAIDNTLELRLDITSKEGKKNIERILKEGFDANGLANIKDNPINQKALDYARESTFTNSLDNGSYLNWGSKIENLLRQSPEFRFIMPFIRTPTNLWRHFSNRIPGFGLLTKQNKELWNSGDRRARAEVLGRQALGFAGTMYALDVALEYVETKDGMRLPKLTGNGPANFDIKKQWLSLGWQPYSFARQNSDGTVTYIQYNRMDPRFYVLGIIADLKENIANINDEDKSDIFGSAFLTVFKNVTNKTYLRGLSDVFEVLAEPTPKNISQFFGGVVGNLIPFVSFRSQGIPILGIDPDKEAFQTRSFIDQVISKTPFAKGYLETKRDILTGEPIEKKPTGLVINPDGIASFSFWFMGPTMVGKSSDVKQDPTAYEVARLKLTLSAPEINKFKVDLTEFKKGDQTAYDYWLEQIGKSKDFDGTTLKQKLENTFKTSQYKSAKEGDETFDGGKEYIIKRIFEGYKKLAYANMLQKYPEVRKEIEKSQGYKYEMLTPLKAGEKQIPKGLE